MEAILEPVRRRTQRLRRVLRPSRRLRDTVARGRPPGAQRRDSRPGCCRRYPPRTASTRTSGSTPGSAAARATRRPSSSRSARPIDGRAYLILWQISVDRGATARSRAPARGARRAGRGAARPLSAGARGRASTRPRRTRSRTRSSERLPLAALADERGDADGDARHPPVESGDLEPARGDRCFPSPRRARRPRPLRRRPRPRDRRAGAPRRAATSASPWRLR